MLEQKLKVLNVVPYTKLLELVQVLSEILRHTISKFQEMFKTVHRIEQLKFWESEISINLYGHKLKINNL